MQNDPIEFIYLISLYLINTDSSSFFMALFTNNLQITILTYIINIQT